MIAVAISVRCSPAFCRSTCTCSPVSRTRFGSASFNFSTLVLTGLFAISS